MVKFRNFGEPFLVSVLIMVFSFSIYSLSFAKDYETPHTFKPGDVISADMMNEILSYIKNSKSVLETNDLVGTWTCDAIAVGGICDPDQKGVDGWEIGGESLYRKLSDATITFSNDGDGTFSLVTSSPDPFVCSNAGQHSSVYVVTADTIFYSYTVLGGGPWTGAYRLRKTNKTRVLFNYEIGGSYNPRILICDKQNLPPDHPTDLSATTAGLTVSLSWTDNSSNETGFKILRKDTLKGSYSQIGSASANATSYSDTVSAAGKYWYRVKATNAYGDSLGSNVVKVKVSQ